MEKPWEEMEVDEKLEFLRRSLNGFGRTVFEFRDEVRALEGRVKALEAAKPSK